MVDRLSPILKEEGAEAISFSLIRTEAMKTGISRKPLHEIDSYSWIVFTSANGVACFFDELKEMHKDIRDFAHIHFAVIGEGTRRLWRTMGSTVISCRRPFLRKIWPRLSFPIWYRKTGFCCSGAEEANQVLPDALDAGIAYTYISLYHTVRICARRKN